MMETSFYHGESSFFFFFNMLQQCNETNLNPTSVNLLKLHQHYIHRCHPSVLDAHIISTKLLIINSWILQIAQFRRLIYIHGIHLVIVDLGSDSETFFSILWTEKPPCSARIIEFSQIAKRKRFCLTERNQSSCNCYMRGRERRGSLGRQRTYRDAI